VLVKRIYHIDTEGRGWLSPPPAYAPLIGPSALALGQTHNLMDAFVRMSLPSASASASHPPPSKSVPLGSTAGTSARERTAAANSGSQSQAKGSRSSPGPKVEAPTHGDVPEDRPELGFGDVMDLDSFVNWCSGKHLHVEQGRVEGNGTDASK
jgi:hypothetical protein